MSWTHFYMNGFALRLFLTWRGKTTRKWSIVVIHSVQSRKGNLQTWPETISAWWFVSLVGSHNLLTWLCIAFFQKETLALDQFAYDARKTFCAFKMCHIYIEKPSRIPSIQSSYKVWSIFSNLNVKCVSLKTIC